MPGVADGPTDMTSAPAGGSSFSVSCSVPRFRFTSMVLIVEGIRTL